ncbi:MAG: multiheme c-type cytochrome [Nannocystaceae bacterium]
MPAHYDLRTWLTLGLAATLLTLSAACPRRDPPPGDPTTPQIEPTASTETVDLIAMGRVLGTIAPCGCTTEPLGGLSYAFGAIEARSSASGRVIVEPGSFLFPDPAGPEAPTDEASWAQAEERARLLQKRFTALGDRLVSGIGPTDLSSPGGAGALTALPMPRAIANAADPAALGATTHRLVPAAGGTIGVTAVVDPEAPGAATLGALKPIEAALPEVIAAMRSAGADLVVVQVLAKRPRVEAIVKAVPGIDVAIVDLTEGEKARVGAPPTHVGDTWIVEPGEQVQTVTHLRLTIDRAAVPSGIPGPSAWTVVPPRSQQEAELARLDERIRKFRGDPTADAAFLARLEAERDGIKATLEAGPASAPTTATIEQVKITCKLPADDTAAAALKAYDAWVAEQNMQRFAGVTAPPADPGKAHYVGVDVCEGCHDDAVKFWRTTRHAGAYTTLVDVNKQYDVSCVGCHVTGFRQPGGSEVVENEGLQAVQCEQCHGPGSLHAADPELLGKPQGITRQAPIQICMGCHTPEHSDTFEYNAYMRDVLGEGHGAQTRLSLGPGATGRELREAGFAKAGGPCTKK